MAIGPLGANVQKQMIMAPTNEQLEKHRTQIQNISIGLGIAAGVAGYGGSRLGLKLLKSNLSKITKNLLAFVVGIFAGIQTADYTRWTLPKKDPYRQYYFDRKWQN